MKRNVERTGLTARAIEATITERVLPAAFVKSTISKAFASALLKGPIRLSAPSGFNIADGSVATVMKDGDPVALIKGQDDVWFYAPRAARISRDSNNRPLFLVCRNQIHAPSGAGFETIGGTFAAQLDLVALVPDAQLIKNWTQLITASTGRPGPFTFQPLALRDGSMTLQGVDAYVVDPAAVKNIPVGASSSIAVVLQLNKLGADTFASALGSGSLKLPLVVSLQYKYDMTLPDCHYELEGHNQETYNFFSTNVKATASYFGLFDANVDIQQTREAILKSGALIIKEVVRPNFNQSQIIELQKSLIDLWAKQVLAMIAETPHLDPAVAPNPGGFFGGVSVAIKSYDQVKNLDLKVDVNMQQIRETIYNMSYAFAYQFDALNPKDYLIDIVDDNRAPIVISMAKDSSVDSYSGQFGYTRPDGSSVAYAIATVQGGVGGVLPGTIQWHVGDPEPKDTEVQLQVRWTNNDWEDIVDKISFPNGPSGVSYVFQPGTWVARIKVATDFEMLPAGSIATLSWVSNLPPNPDGSNPKIYNGSLILASQGAAGRLQTVLVEFPISKSAQKTGTLDWEYEVVFPDGTAKKNNGRNPVTKSVLLISKSQI